MDFESLRRAADKLVGFPKTTEAFRRRESLSNVFRSGIYESIPWMVFGIVFFERSPLWMRGVTVALACFFFRLAFGPGKPESNTDGPPSSVSHGNNGREP